MVETPAATASAAAPATAPASPAVAAPAAPAAPVLDNAGAPIAVGDVVHVPCTVTAIKNGNLILQPVHPRMVAQNVTLPMSANQVVKQAPAATVAPATK